ncbi:MAG: hypothetical protein H7227_01905 [Actinobacteria bacterium]|nr:hypothetical protein [Actinomycetota bacterium]
MSAPDFAGTESHKPEWFSLIDADPRIQHHPRNRRIRVIALAGPLLLISTGLLFAQASESQNASAKESSSISATVTSGNSELASSQAVVIDSVANGVVAEPGATSLVTVTSQTSRSPTNSNQSTFPPSTPSGTDIKLANLGKNQGFVAPAPFATKSFSSDDGDDDTDISDKSNGEDEGYEHEDSDEGDDD